MTSLYSWILCVMFVFYVKRICSLVDQIFYCPRYRLACLTAANRRMYLDTSNVQPYVGNVRYFFMQRT